VNKKLDRAIGLNLGLSYAMLYQHAEQAQGSRNASGGNFRFFGRWNVLDRGGKHPGFLGFRAETQHPFTTIPPSGLGDKLGSLWGTAFGFDQQNFSLVQLWWEQHIFRDRLGLRVGKIDQSDIFATYRFDNFNTDFLNSAFSDNPGIAFPDEGLGFIFSIMPRDWFYLTFGLGDANARNTTAGFTTLLNQGEFFYALELGYTPKYQRPGERAYKVTFWQAEAREKAKEPSGRGVALTFEQEIGHGLVPFFRYAFADGKATDVRHFLSAGIGLERPFKRTGDLVGLAFAWGQPQDRKLRDQYGLEAFYRVQVFPYIQLTPDLQVIFNPSKNRQDSTIVVLGLRTRVLF